MQMLTKQNEKDLGNKVIKFFTPWSNWTWYVTEGEKEANGDWLFFGLVEGFEKEWGSFRLSELTEAQGPMGLKIERDRWFDTPVKDFTTDSI
jgi:hypothetical protein